RAPRRAAPRRDAREPHRDRGARDRRDPGARDAVPAVRRRARAPRRARRLDPARRPARPLARLPPLPRAPPPAVPRAALGGKLTRRNVGRPRPNMTRVRLSAMDASFPQGSRLSAEQASALELPGRWELVDGRIVSMSPAGARHGSVVATVARLLGDLVAAR